MIATGLLVPTSATESVIVLPVGSLEDFPRQLPTADARSLLAVATVAYHPNLLAATRTLPTPVRVGSPPPPSSDVVLWLPPFLADRLPNGYPEDLTAIGGRVYSADDRTALAAAAGLVDPPPVDGRDRTVSVDDFYAAAFALLQIRVMTRRLRYTSNLDEIHLQNRLADAATALIDRRGDDAADALHDVFDALATERDHYFSADPHLIDLTLATAETLPRDERPVAPEHHPANWLFDASAVATLGRGEHVGHQSLADDVRGGRVAWCGGGPADDVDLNRSTLEAADRQIDAALAACRRSLGETPKVYARLSGGLPADAVPAIKAAGCIGVVPIDFAAGVGFGDEAKVVWEAGGAEVDALTARPIDAADDASFLDLGPRLGSAIDGGEIATALLTHWPGRVCGSFTDLVRAASWSLALGKFWRIDDYFTDGETPYHRDTPTAGGGGADESLRRLAGRNPDDPLGEAAADFVRSLRDRNRRVAAGIAASAGLAVEPDDAPEAVAAAMGFRPTPHGRAALVLNPTAGPVRVGVDIDAPPPTAADFVYAATPRSGRTDVTLDIPAGGFAVARGGDGSSSRLSQLDRLRNALLRRGGIADGLTLANEFLDVAVDRHTGGTAGVYAGQARGNRLSTRLVIVRGSAKADLRDNAEAVMVADNVEVVRGDPAAGQIRSTGRLVIDGRNVGRFDLDHELHRGMRGIVIRGDVTIDPSVFPTDADPADHYLALRTAAPSDATSYRWIIRDKLHTDRCRRVVAPAGYRIENPDRETTIATAGYADHRRVGDACVDTILRTRSGRTRFEFAAIVDAPDAVAAANHHAAGPIVIPIEEPSADRSPHGYLLHTSGRGFTLLDVRRIDADTFDIDMLRTVARAGSATLRPCRVIGSAERRTIGDSKPIDSVDGSLAIRFVDHGRTTVRLRMTGSSNARTGQ